MWRDDGKLSALLLSYVNMKPKNKNAVAIGKPSPEQTTRNASLVKDYNSKKFSIVDLVSKYQITSQRIYQIINREQKRQDINIKRST